MQSQFESHVPAPVKTTCPEGGLGGSTSGNEGNTGKSGKRSKPSSIPSPSWGRRRYKPHRIILKPPSWIKKLKPVQAKRECQIKDPAWQCKGRQCLTGSSRKNVGRFRAAGGKYCLPSSSEYCQRYDKDWCGGQCKCPGNCPHACGRCPPNSADAKPKENSADVKPKEKNIAKEKGSADAGPCLLKDASWHCKGRSCLTGKNRKNVDRFSAAGGPYCLAADSEYCQKEDKSWCHQECRCPGNCPHACGRCPPSLGRI